MFITVNLCYTDNGYQKNLLFFDYDYKNAVNVLELMSKTLQDMNGEYVPYLQEHKDRSDIENFSEFVESATVDLIESSKTDEYKDKKFLVIIDNWNFLISHLKSPTVSNIDKYITNTLTNRILLPLQSIAKVILIAH